MSLLSIDVEKLAQCCERLHQQEETACNPLVYLRNKSHKELKNFKNLNRNIRSVAATFLGLSRLVVILVLSLARPYNWNALKKNPPDPKFVFISHLTSKDQKNIKADRYFPDLPEYLSEKHQVLVIRINQTRDYLGTITSPSSTGLLNIINLPITANPLVEIANIVKLLSGAKSLIIDYFNGCGPNNFSALLFLISGQLSTQALTNLRISSLINKVLENTSAKLIVSTFEGHGWERCFQIKMKKSKSNTKLGAYLHAPVTENSNLLLNSQSYKYIDLVFTTGKIPKNLIMKNCPSIESKILGSARSFTQPMTKPRPNYKRRTCLLAPEGEQSETDLFMSLAIKLASNAIEIDFKLSLHPLMSRQATILEHAISRNSLTNLKLVRKPLSFQLKETDFIVYRGTSVVFDALAAGVQPIFYDCWQDEIFTNPLSQRFPFKLIARDQHEIIDYVKKIPPFTVKELKTAFSFARGNFQPINKKVMLETLT